MKKHLFFAFVLLLTLTGTAQVARIRPNHGGNPNPNISLTVTAPRQQSFWLFVDDVLQNENPVHSICINNLWNDDFHIRVELDNQLQNCVGQLVELRKSQTLSIVQADKYFGLEFTQAHVRPELTIDLVTNSPVVTQNEPGVVTSALPPAYQGMDSQDYEEAYQLISNEQYDSSRLTVANQVVSSNPMTASQILGICKLFSFESNKLKFAKFAYSYCTEQNKYYLLNEAFSYESSKRELNEFIKGQ